MRLQPDQVVMVYTTWPEHDVAAMAGARLVEQGLAACVNVLAPATAIYMWDGAPHNAVEHPMLIKTTQQRTAAVVAAVKAHHPYDVPAVIVLPVSGGDGPFLDWIAAATKQDRHL